MPRSLLPATAAFALSALALCPAARADCSSEVVDAVAKQSQQKSYRMDSNVISEQGPLKMTVEYLLPDRMRQVAVLAIDPTKPIETILVGNKAWSNTGEGWQPVADEDVEILTSQLKMAASSSPESVGEFDCIGVETIDGHSQRGYRGKPPKMKGLKNKDGTEQQSTARNDAVRIVYIDTESGLPARSIFAKVDQIDTPIFKEVYSYPPDIKIEAPKDVKP